ncbi:MAG: nucleoside-diphosphate kinase [Nanoarchaeota archaeon]
MPTEKSLVIIKPDAMAKGLAGSIISELQNLNLKIIGLKIVDVSRELAKNHYEEHKEKFFFEKLINHLTGKFHENENVIAIVYKGENAIKKIRKLAGKAHPEEADLKTIRGKYGRHNSKTDCYENAIHASDSRENADREINLWFKEEELVK